jgi:hypothetical protein
VTVGVAGTSGVVFGVSDVSSSFLHAEKSMAVAIIMAAMSLMFVFILYHLF